jgi:long-chain acyl-CoA synthetase
VTVELTGIVSGSHPVTEPLFGDAVAKATSQLRWLGIAPGRSVGLLLRNDVNFLIAQTAVSKAGAYPVLLNWHSGASDIAYVLQDCAADVLIAHADLIPKVRAALPRACRIVSVPTPAEVRAAFSIPPADCRVQDPDIDWRDWMQGQAQAVLDDVGSRGALYYTSGTTGRPKGVVREAVDGAGLRRMHSIVDEVFGVARGQPVRVLVSAPIYHAAPNFFANRGAEPGSLTVLEPRFDAERALALVERYRITHLYLVPTMMIKLLAVPCDVRSRYDLSSLQRVVHSAAPCPRDVKLRMIEWLGPVIYEFYGGTETGCVTLLGSDEWLKKVGSVGRLMQDCGLKVFLDNGDEAEAGAIGEIYACNFRLPAFTYLHLPEKRTEVERDGLITVGDLGYVDEDGYLFLCDRKRDMVISGGANIYPAEIESVLHGMPGVADCAVFGIPDEVFGESVCAHVELKPAANVSPSDVMAWLGERLAGYQVPKIVKIDGGLPREESGKIMKRKIRDLYWQGAGRTI